jgi:hypothetical protein
MSAPRFQIRPLGLWDRPVTEPRTGSGRFRASWDDTIALLVSEVEKLNGDLIVVQVDADPGDLRRDGMLRARAAVRFPGVKVSFESKHGPLTYATDAYDRVWGGDPPGWQINVRAIALALGALRAVDRYGVTRSGEQYRGWTAIAATTAETSLTFAGALRVLAEAAGIQPSAIRTPDDVNRAYRTAVKAAHPDTGGNEDAFRLIGATRDLLLREWRR